MVNMDMPAPGKDLLPQLSILSRSASAAESPCPRASSSRGGSHIRWLICRWGNKRLAILVWWKTTLAGNSLSRAIQLDWLRRVSSISLPAHTCFPPCVPQVLTPNKYPASQVPSQPLTLGNQTCNSNFYIFYWPVKGSDCIYAILSS